MPIYEVEAYCDHCGLCWADYDYEEGDKIHCLRCGYEALVTVIGVEEE